ncbi:MAG: hypothetical protein U0R64_05975 [Candidatus Nanopelagicales bacterium]
MTGVGTLLRFDLSRDRLRILLWVALLAIMVVGVASSWDRLYPSTDERLQLVAILSGNPALTALLGPLTNPLSTGGLTAWRIGVGIVLVLGLVNIFTVTRHVRAEEQAGRMEFLLAGRSRRVAPLWAALGVTVVTSLSFVVLATLLMIAVGLPAQGSLLFASAGAACGWVYAGVAAVTNQIARTARSANAIAGAVLALSWAVTGVGNLQDNALVWVSPFGWIGKSDAFGGDHWGVVAIAVVITLILIAVAAAMQARRDVGAGLLPQREGRPQASPRLTGAYSLAWRLERPVLMWWLLGYIVLGLFIGLSRDALVQFAEGSPALTQILEALGGSGAIIDVFLATYVGLGGIVVAFYAVATVLRLESEEQSGHTEMALATATRRSRWVSSYVVLALLGATAILVALGLALGLSFGLQAGQGLGDVPRLLEAVAAWIPAIIFVVGLTLALVGIVPRWAGLAWVVVGVFALLTELGAVFGLPGWLMNLSPFSHVAKAPAESLSPAPMLWMTLLGVALAVGGYIAVQVRDVRA